LNTTRDGSTADDRQATAHGGAPGEEEPGPVAVAFGARLQSARKQSGLSLREFAQQLAVKTHANLSRAERGLFKPSRALVERIEELTGVRLLEAYDALEQEWQAKAEARKRRRRELARQEAGSRGRRIGVDGANSQSARYPGEAAAEPQDDRSSGQEDNANRRDAVKTIGALLTAASGRARAFLRWAEVSNVGPLTLDEYDEYVQYVAEYANRLPAGHLFVAVDSRFAEIANLLQDGRHSGRQRTHLELLAGQFAFYQSWLSFRLGNDAASRAHLRVARHYGELLDHHMLLSSIAVHASGIAFYQGRYPRAIEIAQEGQQWATSQTAAKLAAEEARAYGSMGRAFQREMADAVSRAEGTLPDRLVFEPGIGSPFGPELFSERAAIACVRAGDQRAEKFGRDAVLQYEALEARQSERFNFENLALARLDLAMALLQAKRPEPREAARLAIQALAVPAQLQTDPVKRRLTELLRMFWDNLAWRHLPAVRELAEAARDYGPPRVLPAPPTRRALGST